jgi:multidrug transporter EmrE-like cation transporter
MQNFTRFERVIITIALWMCAVSAYGHVSLELKTPTPDWGYVAFHGVGAAIALVLAVHVLASRSK